jgi:hypothetical protein
MYYRLVAGARVDFCVIRPSVRRQYVQRSSISYRTTYCDGPDRRTVQYCHRGLLFDSFEWGNLSISVRTSSALADAVAAQYFEIFG